MTRLAIPHWQGRISPVFDVAGSVLLVDVANGQAGERREATLDAAEPRLRARRLAEAGADVLICGAISRPMEAALHAAGVAVIPQICGDPDQVVTAYVEDRLSEESFLMPGCCGQGGGRRRRRRGNLPPPSDGRCECPACGCAAPHLRGQPCNGRNCPECGTPMIRGA